MPSLALRVYRPHILMPTFAGVKDCTAFIRTAQLHGWEPDLGTTALLACLVRKSLCLYLVSFDSLDYREFLSQQGRKIRRLSLGDDDLGSGIYKQKRHVSKLLSTTWYNKIGPLHERNAPLFSAPQQSQFKIFLTLPLDTGRRLPQSVQNIRDPIAAIVWVNIRALFWMVYLGTSMFSFVSVEGTVRRNHIYRWWLVKQKVVHPSVIQWLFTFIQNLKSLGNLPTCRYVVT